MTRDDARKNLVACGVSEPTDEQITSYLNQVNGAIKSEKDRADKYKEEASHVSDLQKQLDEINSKGLSDVERANKATEDALKKVAELERNIKAMQTQKQLAELGIVGEQADNLFDENGNVNFSVFGQILSDTKKNAKAEREKELAGNAGNPGGQGSSNGGNEEKSEGAIYAERFNAQYAPKGE